MYQNYTMVKIQRKHSTFSAPVAMACILSGNICLCVYYIYDIFMYQYIFLNHMYQWNNSSDHKLTSDNTCTNL